MTKSTTTMPGAKAFKRNRMIISFPVQGRIMFYGLLIHVLLWLFLFVVTDRAFEALMSSHAANMLVQENRAFFDFATDIRNYLNFAFFAGGAVSFFGLLSCQVLLTNRLIGPTYRMTGILKKINSGETLEPSSFNLRKGDFFTDLAEQIKILMSRK